MRVATKVDTPLIGFSPRATALTLYLSLNFDDYTDTLARLGKHKIGKGCLYVKRLSDVDMTALTELITDSVAAARQHDRLSHSPTGRNRPSVFGRLPEDGRIAWCEVIVRQRGPTHSIESKPPHGVALATPADEKPLTTVLRQNVRLNCPHRLRTVPIHVVQRHDSTLFETLLDGLPVRARIRQNPAVTANPHAATELGDLATTLLVHRHRAVSPALLAHPAQTELSPIAVKANAIETACGTVKFTGGSVARPTSRYPPPGPERASIAAPDIISVSISLLIVRVVTPNSSDNREHVVPRSPMSPKFLDESMQSRSSIHVHQCLRFRYQTVT